MYKYILLDLDETIWNFKAAEKLAFKETLDTHGIPYGQEIADYYSVINLGLWKSLEKKEVTKEELKSRRFELTYQKALELYPDVDIPHKDGAIINETYMNAISHHGIMLDGAEEFLQKLDLIRKEKGLKVFYITNGIAITAHGRISNSGIRKYADGAFISEEVGVDKPDKKYFNYVTNAVGEGDSSLYLVIGDSLTSDIQGAENAGMDACLFAYYGKYPSGADSHNIKYRATSYEDLLAIIEANT